jgi:DNA invertase Pin-like site-specific DNA recombinase
MGRSGPGYISPDVQREAIQRWADYREITIGEWHVDEDQSGGTQNRPGLIRAMDRIEAGETDGIAVWRLNRFARNVPGAIRDIERIQDAGGVFASVEEDIDPTGPFGSFVLTILLAVATLERDNIVKSWETAKARAIGRGVKIGPTPLGYVRADDRTLLIDEPAAEIVREAFRLAAMGSDRDAAAHLAQATGRTLSTATLRRVTSNRTYLGELHHGELVKIDAHDPIVDRVTFAAAQRDHVATRRASGSFPLSAIARCATCDSPMVGSRGGKGQRTYRCSASLASHKGNRCKAPANITARILEEHVVEHLADALEGKTAQPLIDAPDLQTAETELDRLQRELETFAADNRARDLLGDDGWTAALEQRVTDRDAARSNYDDAARAAFGDKPRANLSDELAEMTPEQLGSILQVGLDQVIVTKGRGPAAGRIEIVIGD